MNEILKQINKIIETLPICGDIFIFGHTKSTEQICDVLLSENYLIKGIMDNNPNKQGAFYKKIPIVSPDKIIESNRSDTVVLIASRAHAAMIKQLNDMGYLGRIENIVEYNTFSEYSLSEETVIRKRQRLQKGMAILSEFVGRYKDTHMFICPYAALGDVNNALAYLPYYLKNESIKRYVVIVVGKSCYEVAKLYNIKNVETLVQSDMDELVQAVIYNNAENTMILHHDRPYTSMLIDVLKIKCIAFEDLYRSGVYGLKQCTEPYKMTAIHSYNNEDGMIKGHSVILSPYAKSVVGVNEEVWKQIIKHYDDKGYKIYTNVAGDEEPLKGTSPLKIPISMLQSAVEYAGTFIGIRSGLCDVIKYARCKKIALYPDCYYSSTKWKVVDFFAINGWDNIVVE